MRGIRSAMVALALAAAAAQPVSAQDNRSDAERMLRTLVETYGPSGMEGPVRDAVQRLLPAWARAETDTAGNLRVRVGQGGAPVVFVAHLDEVGFRITAINDDGSLQLARLGGFFPSLFEAQAALVHTGARAPVPGIFRPRTAADAPPRRTPEAIVGDVGTTSRAATDALGIRIGHTMTMPKHYVRLAGTRVTGRSFDDRVGATALLLALNSLDRSRLDHEVIFLWSVREEIGLEGAEAAARALGLAPRRVHAVDTFVSADSPLEHPAFGVARAGEGAVVRAIDNSAVAPPPLVDSLVALARARAIPLQLGATNGGNDGSAFAPWGVPDVPIAWPLRYSHSPAEVSDLLDVVALGELVRAIAEEW
ncbi:MAG TPA: M20/M25/M40 family metallo-hydrolase [Gemmatimonadales bacterium]|nr:M20/M25/M40 family metallo-hydrolase [Gemmatimonadales bacterium]